MVQVNKCFMNHIFFEINRHFFVLKLLSANAPFILMKKRFCNKMFFYNGKKNLKECPFVNFYLFNLNKTSFFIDFKRKQIINIKGKLIFFYLLLTYNRKA